MATYQKQANGTYKATVSFNNAKGIRQRKVKRGFSTITEAKNWGIEMESKKISGQLKNQSHVLLPTYFKDWYQTYKTNVAYDTLTKYENALNNILKDDILAHSYIDELTDQQFQQFLNRFGQTHSRESVRKIKNFLSAAFKRAHGSGLITRNPTIDATLTGYAGKNQELKFLEEAQINQVLTYCQTHFNQVNFMIYTALLSGARIGELRALSSEDVDVANATISINKARNISTNQLQPPKNKQSVRVIEMPQRWVDTYQRFKDTHEHDELFNISNNGANKALKKLLTEIGAKDITFHGLRHSHASWLLAQGVDIYYISERLGHGSVDITMKVYTHLLKTKRASEIEKTLLIMQ